MNLPFSIDRSSRIKLPYQVADGLRSAIQSGVWKPGERIPSVRELKAALGVSVRAPMEALQMLAGEGIITLREKCGAVVASVCQPLVKGRVTHHSLLISHYPLLIFSLYSLSSTFKENKPNTRMKVNQLPERK